MRRGLYRVHGIDGRPDDVRVDDDGIAIPLEEHLYRARGYLPLVDHLPWQDEYFSKKAASDGPAAEAAARKAREQARREFLTRFDKS
jgi:hypothetical protein